MTDRPLPHRCHGPSLARRKMALMRRLKELQARTKELTAEAEALAALEDLRKGL